MARMLTTQQIRSMQSARRLGLGLASALRCGEQLMRVGTQQGGFCVDNLALVWLQSGRAILRQDGQAWMIQAGDAFHRLPGQPHTLTVEEDVHSLFCAVPPQAMALLRSGGLPRLGDDLVIRPGLHKDVAERWRRSVRALATAPPRTLARNLLTTLDLIVDLHLHADRRRHPAADRIDAACRLLDQDQALSLDAVAQRVGMGASTLRRVFVELIGCPPWTWRLQRRIDRARELLVQQDLPISIIADQCGFEDPADFSRRFRHLIGETPTAYRKRNG